MYDTSAMNNALGIYPIEQTKKNNALYWQPRKATLSNI